MQQTTKYLLVALVMAIACIAVEVQASSPAFSDIEDAQVLYVTDGDVFYVNIPSFPPLIGHEIAVRVRGIDAPELRNRLCFSGDQTKACVAKRFTTKALAGAKNIVLTKVQRDSYFRINATVLVDGHNLADLLHAAGLGTPSNTLPQNPWPVSTYSDIAQGVRL